MINFDSLTLKALLKEIALIIENSRVQKIRQSSRQELLLTLRNNSKNHTLFISTKPSFAHLCLLEEATKHYRFFDFPSSPPMFCMLLRKYLENAKIEKVVQPEHERIVEFYFTAYGELGERISLVLAVELMGKHSNMILYNANTKIILGCAHNVGEEKSKIRELVGGLNYVYPPKIYKKDINTLSFVEFFNLSRSIETTFSKWLNETFYDISIPMAKEICLENNIPTESDFGFALSQELLQKVFESVKEKLSLMRLKPSVSTDFESFSLNDVFENKYETVNDMVSIYFGKNSFKEMLERKGKRLKSVVEREIKKIKRLIKKLSLGFEFEEKIVLYKQIADTLMANIYLKNFFKNKIELKNVHTGENVIIEIDTALSINDNAQNYYKLYSKAKRTKETNEELFEKYKEKENYFLGIKAAIDLAQDLEILEEIEEELFVLLPKQNEKKITKNKKILIQKIEENGYEIFVGKNNKQNDYIVSKLSSPEDFWFHVHGDFGSHVLVKNPKKEEVLPDEIILKAATVAAKYSSKKNDVKADVIYTKRKYLRKPPAANLGYVIYKNEKEITVEI